MPFCIRCSTFNCDIPGLISISVNSSSSVRPAEDQHCGTVATEGKYIPGPAIINATFNAYAFDPGSNDKWLGSRCRGSAQASQSNIQRYDAVTDKWWLIPSKIHKAQIVGQIGFCSLGQVFFSGHTLESNSSNGVTIATEMGIDIGADFSYAGPPFGVSIPDLNPWRMSIGTGADSGYISSFQANVDFPQPATVSYTFEFPLSKTE